MRLLRCDNAGRITLTGDLPDAERPRYAILSHTWSPAGIRDEVSLDDLMKDVGTEKPGYYKIRFCAQQAKRDGLEYFWIDTCCINKASDAELSKSLVSMFRWYKEAEKCYVYLADVSRAPSDQGSQTTGDWEDDFRVSRWFRRGWTLQELLAPSSVEFFSRDGRRLGTRLSLENLISGITQIPILSLRGQALSDFTVEERLRWQEGRETKEPEDMVYSLLGIFDVAMPALYGEGQARARKRLLNEIATARKGIQYKDFSVTFCLSEVVETPDFVAREPELQEIHDKFGSDGRRKHVVLQGLGGIGKTQMAIAYAVRHREDYSAILWLNADNEESIKSSFARTATQILRDHPSALGMTDLKQQEDLGRTVKKVKAWLSLRTNTRWLIICDNYDNPVAPGNSDPAAFDLRTYLPEAYQGSVLITTRSTEVQLGHCIHVQKLKRLRDGLRILESSSGRENVMKDPDAERLARKLDGLPLALATAGAYLSQNAVSFTQYLDSFEQSWARLQQSSPALSGIYQNRTLFSTWQISFEQIKRKNHLSANLLRWWAYFDHKDVWFELLNHVHVQDPEWMQELTQDELEFRSAMQVLCQHGLVDVNPSLDSDDGSQGYGVHACVHSWMLTVLNTDTDHLLASAALWRVALHVPHYNWVNSSRKKRRLLDHANRCSSYIRRYDSGKASQHSECHCLGDLYLDLGRLANAEEMYQQALRGRERALGPNHARTLQIANNLGLLYAQQGKMAEAEAMFQRALMGYEKEIRLGPDRASYLGTLHNLGTFYVNHGKFADAETTHLRALQECEEDDGFGPSHPLTLKAVSTLGLVHQLQGKTAQAEAMFERAMKGCEKYDGPEVDNWFILDTLSNLGLLCKIQGKTAEAEKIYQRLLRDFEKAVGPHHSSTINTVCNLGFFYAEQKRMAEAEELYQRARNESGGLPADVQASVDRLGKDLSRAEARDIRLL